MRVLQSIGIISLAVMFFVSIGVIESSAQTRVRVNVGSRPSSRGVYVRQYRYPRSYGGWNRFGYDGFGYDPFWSDPYYTNPRLRELADRVHNENEVRSSRRKLREYSEKFYADGYLSDKEQKKLDKAQRKYDKNVRRLHNDE